MTNLLSIAIDIDEIIDRFFYLLVNSIEFLYSIIIILFLTLILIVTILVYRRKTQVLKESLERSNLELSVLRNSLIFNEEEYEQKNSELALTQENYIESEEKYRLIMEAANDAILDIDIRKGHVNFSERWSDITGYTPEELDNMDNLHEIILPENINSMKSSFNRHKQRGESHFTSEHRMKLKNGEYKWFLVRGKCLFDDKGTMYRMAAAYTDIDQLKKSQQLLKYLAYNDSLTELPNRVSLYEKLNSLFQDPSCSKGALIFIDIDNFKLINDVLGHAFGDLFISSIGKKLSSLLTENSSLFRIGGDEFIIYIHNYNDISEINDYASSLIKAFKEPLVINDSKINTSISMGIAQYPEDGTNVDELLKNADIAMYKAKYSGKGKYTFYNKHMNKSIIERMEIEKCLRNAMEKDEFLLYYQPKINIETGCIAGFEALIRWNSPELGIVPPTRFIEIAEESQLIIPLGEWVLKNTCAFVKKLIDNGYSGYKVSVNISIIQLMQDDFVDMVIDILDNLKLPPGSIELEITESILMESFEIINNKLDILRKKGVLIALDDFGKGYSSLNYLKQLPITTLKIDKSFVDSISNEKSNDSFIDTIVNMGHKISLIVVAEGVESPEQLEYLRHCMCDEFQGYLFSKPIPENDVLQLLSIQKTY